MEKFVKGKKTTACVQCAEAVSEDEKVQLDPCDHPMHPWCWDHFESCPTCRTPLKRDLYTSDCYFNVATGEIVDCEDSLKSL